MTKAMFKIIEFMATSGLNIYEVKEADIETIGISRASFYRCKKALIEKGIYSPKDLKI